MTPTASSSAARIACAIVFLVGGLPLARPALAAAMRVMESRPAAQAVMAGGQTEFFVRFDGPVDHGASVLSVLRDGRVVQTLHPRLNSQPNTLYSGAPKLQPGAYTLHWTTRSMRERDISEGDIPFSVR